MEASFKCRVDETFGSLFGPAGAGISTSWSVRESTIAKNRVEIGGAREAESSGSDGEEQDGNRYDRFVKLEASKRRSVGLQGEQSELEFFGEEDLLELESEEEDEDDEEGVRHGKRKKRGEQQTAKEKVTASSRGDGEEGEGGGGDVTVHEEEEDSEEEARQIRLMVGMDDTLDFEEEEDEFDKLAAGREGYTDDRLFMGHVKDFGAILKPMNTLPNSFSQLRQANRDARANHKAALARLEEDDRQAASRVAEESSEGLLKCGTGTLRSQDASMVEALPFKDNNDGDAMDIDGDGSQKEDGLQHPVAGICKPSNGKQRKSGKRVRFALAENGGNDGETRSSSKSDALIADMPQNLEAFKSNPAQNSVLQTMDRFSRVPDYVKNPSKYIHYTIDWTEEDEEQQNLAAFRAFKGKTSSSSTLDFDKQEGVPMEPQGTVELQKVNFNPLVSKGAKAKDESVKKSHQVSSSGEPDHGTGRGLVNVVANFEMDNSQSGEPKLVKDDEDTSPSSERTTGAKSNRVLRRYRTKPEAYEDSENSVDGNMT